MDRRPPTGGPIDRPARSRDHHGPSQGHRHRRRECRRDHSPADRGSGDRGRRPHRHRRGTPAGKGPRSRGGGPGRWSRRADHRHQRLRGHGRLGHRRRHERSRAPAGHEPGRPAGEERGDRPIGRHRSRGGITARDPHHRHEPARRDVSRRDAGLRLPARAGPGHGRRARLGTVPDVHRAGARCQRVRHPRVRTRWPWRHDGAAAALLDRGRHPAA